MLLVLHQIKLLMKVSILKVTEENCNGKQKIDEKNMENCIKLMLKSVYCSRIVGYIPKGFLFCTKVLCVFCLIY